MALTLISYFSFGQTTCVSADRNNILYIDVENPLTIVAENTACKDLIVKTDNGTITGKGCYYICKPAFIGKATITVSIKKNGKILDRITLYDFRVKRMFDIPNIKFKIGPCGNDCTINKNVLAAQEYVRGEIVNTEFDARAQIDSFSVYLYTNDTCIIKSNTGNKISEEIRNEFRSLHTNDIVVFRNIYAKLPDNTTRELESVMIFIKD